MKKITMDEVVEFLEDIGQYGLPDDAYDEILDNAREMNSIEEAVEEYLGT